MAVTWSSPLIVSLTASETIAGGRGGAPVPLPVPPSAMDCVKVVPLTKVLGVTLLSAALSVKVMIPLGVVPGPDGAE